MYGLSLLSLASLAITAAAQMTATIVDANAVLGFDPGPDNFYNAPSPPWVAGATPGWYYGPNPQKYPDLWVLQDFMCRFLFYYPDALHCPTEDIIANYNPGYPTTTTSVKTTTATATTTTTTTVTVLTTTGTTTTTTATITITSTPVPSDGYIQTFSNITSAVQADDFMTFGLVETVADCKAMCDSVPGCTFVNSFHDVNGKGGSTDLTCSLFKFCHTAADADNAGGQSQPDGSIDFIINSDGWCKVGNATTTTTTASSSTASSTTSSVSSTSTSSTSSPTPTFTTTSSTKTSSTSTSTSSKPTSTVCTTTTSTIKSTSTTKTTSTTPTPTQTKVAHYYQCGGIGYSGPTVCAFPFNCLYQNPWYSQCL